MAQVEIEVVAKDSFSSTLGNFGSIMTGIESAINLAGQAFQTFAGFAMQGLDAIASYERMAASLETLVAKEILASGAANNMTQALRESGAEAQGLLTWTQQLAINSPFTAEGVNNAFRMAMAYGFTSDEAKRLTEAMIDFAAGSGASEYAMEAIARALGQISATGKVTGGDMLQLVNAGLPVVEILAEGFGVTTAELMKMREKGLLPATEAIEYITLYLEKNFAGAAERQATTWAGLQGTFADIKNMGLREFFGGMFEALQPLAVQLSEFLQTEGMDKLREWGYYLGLFTQSVVTLLTGEKLYDLGYQLQQLAGKDSIFYALGTSIRVFQQAIDDGATNRDAFLEGLDKFEQLTGTDFSLVVDIALGDVTEAQINEFLIDLDVKMGTAIGNFDWSAAGDAFGQSIQNAITGGIDSNRQWWENIPFVIAGKMIIGFFKTETIAALARGISDWFLAAMNLQNWGEFLPRLSSLHDIGLNMGKSIGEGMRAGLTDFWHDVGVWVDVFIIEPVKKALGIASPSTVFMQIGRDMVLGLLSGWGSTIGSFLSVVQSFIDRVLGLFAPVLDILGIDLGGTTSTGTVGGRSPGTTDPRDGGPILTGSGIVNNFYGPVYVGSMQELYDCPSPHPLMTASSQSLLTSTISP